MLLNHLGTPEPPSDIVRRLRQVDPDLGMRYVPAATGPCWAITLRWPETDARRGDIKRGLRDPAFDWDAVAFLPLDCPPDQAFGYFQRGVRSMTGDRARWLVEHAQEFNRTVTEQAFQGVVDDALEQVESAGSRLFEQSGGRHVPKSTRKR